MPLSGYSFFRLCHGSSPPEPEYRNVNARPGAFITASDYGVTDAEPGKRGSVRGRDRDTENKTERKRVIKRIKRGLEKKWL